jgi:integrase
VSALALLAADEVDLPERLAGLVRPEFAVDLYHPAPDDPVLGAPCCAVAGCERPSAGRALCAGHLARWTRHGRPELAAFAASTPPFFSRRPRADEVFDLSGLTPSCRLEVGYVLQRRHDERGRGLRPAAVRPVVALLARSGAGSLLDRPLGDWLSALRPAAKTTRASAVGFLRYAWREIEAVAGGGVEAEYARDAWDARRLCVPVTVGHHRVSFASIPQRWLREAVKTWARSRLVGGMSFGAIRRDVTGLTWFGRFLQSARPGASGPSVVTRATIEAYLAHLAANGPVANTRLGYLTSLRGFLESARRKTWLALPSDAVIYHDDLPRRPAGLPRFVPEDVMAQLGAAEALARLPDPTTRHLLVVLVETGLRAGDACRLRRDCLLADSVGWPCLRFMNTKAAAEQLVPLTAAAAEAVRAQQAEVQARFPSSPFLFPAPTANPDGARPFTYNCLRQRLRRWQDEIDLRGAAGLPVRVSAHQFRHSFGTRLINQGVPQHVVQRLLGHASPQMTATYARLHDSTVRREFEAWCATRVDVNGRALPYEGTA